MNVEAKHGSHMLLLTMNEWVGAGKNYPSTQKPPDSTNRMVAFSSRLPLNAALERLRSYEEAFNAHYQLAVNFTLLGVQTIGRVDEELLQFFRAELVERLPQRVEDF